jgi:V/A-type H+/Na+-transporting ATPase subunit I
MIAQMNRIEVLFLRSRLDEMVPFLQGQGVVHVEEVPLAVEDAPGFLHRVHLTREQEAERESLTELQRILDETAPLLAVRCSHDEIAGAAAALESTPREEWRRKARHWSRDFRSLTRRRGNLEDNLQVLSNHHEQLVLVNRLLGSQPVVLGENARAFVLKGDVEPLRRRLRKRLRQELGPETQFFDHAIDHSSLLGVVTYPECRNKAAGAILCDEGIDLVDLADKSLDGIALAEVLTQIEERIAGCKKDVDAFRVKAEELSKEIGPELLAMQVTVADRLGQLQIVGQFAQSDMIAVVHGWVPRRQFKDFAQALEDQFAGESYLGCLPVERVERSRIPILLQNAAVLRPFEVLMSLMKPPTYGTIDPSVMVGVFFVLFYGFILGDVIYGLVVIGFAGLLRHYLGRHEAARQASIVGLYAGLSAIVFGVLYGEYCGNLGHQLFPALKPLWFPREHDTLKLLKIAVSIGAVHVVLSLVIAVWTYFQQGQYTHAMEKLGMLLALLAVGVAVLSILGVFPLPQVLAFWIAAIMFVTATVILIRATGAFAALHLIEVISLVANVLSYSRLMALGIASVALADVANRLAQMAGSLWAAIPVFLAVHLLNVAMGMFSPTLHSLRLNYVEFLPKFYTPEGRSYTPFKKEVLW